MPSPSVNVNVNVNVDGAVFRSVSAIIRDAAAAFDAINTQMTLTDADRDGLAQIVKEFEERASFHVRAIFGNGHATQEVVAHPTTYINDFRAFVVRRQLFAPHSSIIYACGPAEVQRIVERAYGGGHADTWIYDTAGGKKYHKTNSGEWLVADIVAE